MRFSAANRSRLAAAGLLATLVLGGCGSGSDSSQPGTPPTAEQDAATARSILLTAKDLPGFIASPADTSDASPTPLDACGQGNQLLLGGSSSLQAEGDSLKLDAITVESDAVLAETADQAAGAMAVFGGADFGNCMNDAFNNSMGAELTAEKGEEVSVSTSTSRIPDESVGGEAVTYRVAMEVGLAGGTGTGVMDLSMVRKGRALAMLMVGSIGGEPYPDANRAGLLRTMVDRMPDNV